MRFTTLLTTATAVGLAAALPAPADGALAERASENTVYTIYDFAASVYPNTNDVYYTLDVHAKSDNSARSFRDAYCQVDLKADELIPLSIVQCESNRAVVMSFTPYKEDGEVAGWKLGISHPYHTEAGLFVDGVSYKFPLSTLVTKGSGKKEHSQYTAKKLVLPVGSN